MNHVDKPIPIDMALDHYRRYQEEMVVDEPLPLHSWMARHYPHLMRHYQSWPKTSELEFDGMKNMYAKTNLTQAFWDMGYESNGEPWTPNIVERYSQNVAEVIQFPTDTAFLFALGAVASAMTRQFTYNLSEKDDFTKSPVNLYVIAAQPAGTGKSGVLKNLVRPIEMAYAELNTKQHKIRGKLLADEERLKADIKKATNDDEKAQLYRDLKKVQQDIDNTPVYIYSVDDATPESLRGLASQQLGFFNMVSEEANLIDVVLGTVYGDGRRKNNNGIFLKAWDGEHVSIARAGQEVVSTQVRATMAVMAQDVAIHAILEAGQSGTGINERVLFIREPDMHGDIDIRKRMRSTVDIQMRAEYQGLVSRLVMADPDKDITHFSFDRDATEALTLYLESQQMMINSSHRYRDDSIIGVLSKAQKQICKIACVLHAAKCYSVEGVPTRYIGQNTMRRAIGIFRQLIEVYIKQAIKHGYAGNEPRIEAVMSAMQRYYTKNRKNKMRVNNIRDSVRKNRAFSRVEDIRKNIQNEIIPTLEKLAICATNEDGDIFVNPREFD